MNKELGKAYLFHGEDDFSIKRKVDFWKTEFAKKYSQSSIVVLDGGTLGSELGRILDEAMAPSLFSDKKLIICRNCFPTKASDDDLAEAIIKASSGLPKDYFLVFVQTKSPDKRLNLVKKILALPIEIQEFRLPIGRALNSWIKAEAKRGGASIDDQASELLAVYLGRDLDEKKPLFNLWQAHNELEKLASKTKDIKVEDVQSLILPKLPENIFELSDKIIEGRKKQALQSLEYLMAASAGDEKSEVIRIVSLLAEQFRGLATVGSLAKHKKQQEIAEMLGWTSGRVFINLKLSQNASLEKIKRYLKSLLLIDHSLKSSDANPRLLLDMFIQGG